MNNSYKQFQRINQVFNLILELFKKEIIHKMKSHYIKMITKFNNKKILIEEEK